MCGHHVKCIRLAVVTATRIEPFSVFFLILFCSFQFCSVCKNSGATLGCFQKACNQKYHYLCALNTGTLQHSVAY